MNTWKSVFVRSRMNEGCYDEKCLPDLHWEWPKGTWFQTRLDYARDRAFVGRQKGSRKLEELDIAWSNCKAAEVIKTTEELPVETAAILTQPEQRKIARASRNAGGKDSRARQPRQKRTKISARKKASPPPMCAS